MPSSHDIKLTTYLEDININNIETSPVQTIHTLDELSEYLLLKKTTAKDDETFVISLSNQDLLSEEKIPIKVESSLQQIISRQGFSLSNAKPILFLHTNSSWLVDIFDYSYNLEKTLSWSTSDQDFFDFIVFLESTLLVNLPWYLSEKTLLYIDHKPDSDYDFGISEKNYKLLKHEPITSTLLKNIVNTPLRQWREQLDEYLQNPRSLAFFSILFSGLKLPDKIKIDEYVSKVTCEKIQNYLLKTNIQSVAEEFVSSWYKLSNIEDIMVYENISLGAGLEYELIGEVLTNLGAFKEIN